MPSVSSAVAGFFWVHAGGHRVHPGSVGSLVCALYAIGFIRGDWVNWGATSGPSGSFWFAGFTVVRPRGLVIGFAGVSPGSRQVHLGSLGSLVCALGAVGLTRCRLAF